MDLGDEDGASVKSLLTNMSTMLTALMVKVDRLDPATGCPGRTVEFQDMPTAPHAASTSRWKLEHVPAETMAPPFTYVSEEVHAKVSQ